MADQPCARAEGEIDYIPALVPPGIYSLKFTHWWTGIMFGRSQKLALCFKTVDFGENFDTEVRRWYNVKVRGRTGRNGQFSAGWGSDLLREYVAIIGTRKRNDRIALNAYSGLIVRAEVGTVNSTRTQEKLPIDLQYSVIRKLVGVEAGRKQYDRCP